MNERLTLEQIEQGIEQCIKSAREIIHSANTLNGVESRRVSLSLYILAIEELGKAVLMYRTLFLDNNDDAWKIFWESFRDHKPKLLAGAASWSADMFNLDPDAIAEVAFKDDPRFFREMNATKQLGFYIIYNEQTKSFEKGKFNYISWDLWSNVANYRVRELEALSKIGLFRIENLTKLRKAFVSIEGKKVLEEYKLVKGTLPMKQRFSSKEYQKLLQENDLNTLLATYQTVVYQYAKSLMSLDRNISFYMRPWVFIRGKMLLAKYKKGRLKQRKVSKKEPIPLTLGRLSRGGLYFFLLLMPSIYVILFTKTWLICKVLFGIWGFLCLIILQKTVKLIIRKMRFPWM